MRNIANFNVPVKLYMRRRFLHIFTFTLLATVCAQGVSYAQEEGEEMPIKQQENTVLEKDSIPDDGTNAGEIKGDFINQILITPKEKAILTPDIEILPNNSAIKKPALEGNKIKEQETPSNFKFNFIYYLFYKFKVGSTSSTSGS